MKNGKAVENDMITADNLKIDINIIINNYGRIFLTQLGQLTVL